MDTHNNHLDIKPADKDLDIRQLEQEAAKILDGCPDLRRWRMSKALSKVRRMLALLGRRRKPQPKSLFIEGND